MDRNSSQYRSDDLDSRESRGYLSDFENESIDTKHIQRGTRSNRE